MQELGLVYLFIYFSFCENYIQNKHFYLILEMRNSGEGKENPNK